MVKCFILFFVGIILSNNIYCQLPPVIPHIGEKVSDFIPENWRITKKIDAFINEDSLVDIIMAIEDKAYLDHRKMITDSSTVSRLLIVLLNKGNNYETITVAKHSILSRSFNIIPIFPKNMDPLDLLEFDNNRKTLTINHLIIPCGSYFTSHRFRYQDGDFYLIEKESSMYGDIDEYCPEGNPGSGESRFEDFITGTIETVESGHCKQIKTIEKIVPKQLIKLSDFNMNEKEFIR